jgi:hypothetical protein
VQSELQQKYELLAQLEESPQEHAADAFLLSDTQPPAAAWCDVGSVLVDVLEGRCVSGSARSQRQLDTRVKHSVRVAVQSQRIASTQMSTKWSSSMQFQESMLFNDRARDESLQIQVRASLACAGSTSCSNLNACLVAAEHSQFQSWLYVSNCLGVCTTWQACNLYVCIYLAGVGET